MKHSLMTQNKEHDLFAVAAGSPEVRVYHLNKPAHGHSKIELEKLFTLSAHRSIVTDVALAGLYCVTISAHDMQLYLHKITNLEFGQNTVAGQKQVSIDNSSKVAIMQTEDKTRIAVTTDKNNVVIYDQHLTELSTFCPNNSQAINMLRFIGDDMLWTASRMDGRVNSFTV